ncbi:MAG: carbohydrate-binding protein [Cytophagales bacterium]|nr:carbohydrate-binding protein [Cytophagales bacterium]
MMKKLTWLLLILFSCCFTCLYGQDLLHVSGKDIVDSSGEPYILKGMGLGGWMLQEGYMLQTASFANPQHQIRARIADLIGEEDTQVFYDAWLANHVRKIDIDSLAAWGFNSVRLPIHYNLFTLPIEDEPVAGENTWLEVGFALTDSLIKWCKANDMYVVLDLHAAPGGQGQDEGISDYDTSKPSLWESEANRAKTIALWRKIAEKYVDETAIAGYDLINEPNWPLDGNTLLRELYGDITAAIREVDQNHIIFIEGNWFANDFTGLTPPWDDNMVYSPHKYWSINDQSSIQWVLDIREQNDIPLYLGETGENSNTWFRDAVELFETHNIGWAWWPMKKVESIAGPLSVTKSEDYQTLLDYWSNGGTKPTAEFARSTLMTLTEDLKLENSHYQKDVIDALFRQVEESGTIPFRTQEIPGRIDVTDFDLGANGEAYFDADIANYQVSTGSYTAWNQGWAYRNDGVDIELSSDPQSNGYNVGWISSDEWMKYDINVTESANYQVSVRVASGGEGGKFHLQADGSAITSVTDAPATGDWQGWQTVVIEDVILDTEDQKLTFYADQAGFNLSAIHFEVMGSTTEVDLQVVGGQTITNEKIQVDFNKRISGELNSEDFRFSLNNTAISISNLELDGRSLLFDIAREVSGGDELKLSYAGNGISANDGTMITAFSDKSITNTIRPMHEIPGQIEAEDFFVQSGIALEATTDTGGGENIGFLDRGDYLDYQVNILVAGEYLVTYRTAAESETGAAKATLIDENGIATVLHDISFEPTGGWQNWASTTIAEELPVGAFTLRIEITEPLFNINWIAFEQGLLLNVNSDLAKGIYPNPTSDWLTLTELDMSQTLTFKVFDLNGKLYQSGKIELNSHPGINVAALPEGIYVLQVFNKDQPQLTTRFIKQNSE